MNVHDPAYYSMRAEAEARQAELARTPEAARAHERLSQLYRERAQQPKAYASV